jgi:hypothetical protein
MARIYVSSTYGDLTAPLCVIYEGWVSVKTWSAPGWLAGVGGRGPGGGRVDQWTSPREVDTGVMRPWLMVTG